MTNYAHPAFCGCTCAACQGGDHTNCSHVAVCWTQTICKCTCNACRLDDHVTCKRRADRCKLPNLPRADRTRALKHCP